MDSSWVFQRAPRMTFLPITHRLRFFKLHLKKKKNYKKKITSLETSSELCVKARKNGSKAFLVFQASEFIRSPRGGMDIGGQESNRDDLQRKEQRLPFQIFPDPVEVVLGPETSLNSLSRNHERERLPSIVVEPTEVSEVESGELRWPPENIDMDEEDEEDLFLEQCIPPANIADWGEEDEEEEEEEEETSVILSEQQGLTLIDLQSDAFRDDTPTLPPSSAPAFN
ncbi:uncharacterized protein lbhl isoform X2 [Nerophis ophidion]|uniref:uncharacterized protein lbhl isoform X2 n=1 Tax=Nerophis ophidion TaxID=159077 RepID=UPI002ADF14D7|nr:uncharacterized protein lbhl isoform X2 [Nerophis ophidion]